MTNPAKAVFNVHKLQNEHWKKFYSFEEAPTEPSTFANFCHEYLKGHDFHNNKRVVEFGCGNGRDAVFFASNDYEVFALDKADVIISSLTDKYKELPNIRFCNSDFTRLNDDNCLDSSEFDIVYSRFTLHAIPEIDATRCLKWASENLIKGGYLFIEARSVNSSLYGKGTPAGRDAFIYGHYRRFIRREELRATLEHFGFQIDFEIESDGLAVYKDDNPVLIRIVAKKMIK